MEEAVIKEKKKGEEKRKLANTVGESSRSTKRGTGRSFSAGRGNSSCGGPTFRGNSGPRFSGPVGFNRGSIEASSFTMPSIGSGRGAGQSYSRGTAFTPSCSTCGRQHLGQYWGPDATPRICYNGRGRGHISRDCLSQTLSLGGSASRGTQSQSSIGSSGQGAERGRGRGRGTGNRDGDHNIGGGMRGFGAQVIQGQTQERIYNMTREEAPASNDVISGGVVVNNVRKGSLVRIGDVTFPVDLVVMDLKEFDIILGMDWLAQHRSVVDCYKKKVMIESSGQPKVVFVAE
ncbi:UNVERIFIED_CONTAM: hypothetical protein Slati_1440600 [Sesamum latifolium]|uniref:Gag-pol polyprotein n=1 Tax=Sesamum latifolium TaxID=2727402 RepID=A0AAW2X3U2_9LAMI